MNKPLLSILIISDDYPTFTQFNNYLIENDFFNSNCYWNSNIKELKNYDRLKSIDIVLYSPKLLEKNSLVTISSLLSLFPLLPVILISDQADVDIINRIIIAGIQDFLVLAQVDKFNLARSILCSLERKKKEIVLQLNEEKYRTIVTNMNEGVIWTDLYDRIEFINHRICDIYGYSENELIGNIAYEILEHPDYKNLVLEKSKSRVNGLSDSYKVKGLKKSGEAIWVQINAFPVKDFHGKIIGTVSIVNDITKETDSIENIREIETKYKLFFDEDLTGDYITNTSGEIVFCNNALVNILKCKSKEELLSKNAFDFYVEKENRYDFINLIKEKRKISNLESTLRAGDGSIVTVIENVIGIFDQDDKLTQIIGYMFDITDRKNAEKMLHDQTYLLTNIIKYLPVGLWIIDSKGKIIHGNPEGQKIWAGAKYVGLDQYHEYKGWWFDSGELIRPDQWAASRAVKYKETTINEEIEIESFNGTHKIIQNSAIPIIKSDGNLLAVLGINIDITEKKRAEKAVLENEKRYRSVVESLNQAYYETDELGQLIYCNPGLFAISGIPENELLGSSCFNLIAEEHRNIITEKYLKSINEKIIDFSFEYLIITKIDRKFWVEQITHLTFDESGEFIRATSTIRDIDERKIAEEELRKLYSAIEQSSACVLISNSGGLIEYVNPHFSELTGYSLNELLGKTPSILKSGHQAAEFYVELWNTILCGKVWSGELLNTKKNGELFWASTIISPIINQFGKVTHFVAIEEDITEKKKLIEELINAKEKAEISDRLKTEFLAQMSHEIRTPLNIISSNAEFIRDEFGHLIPEGYEDLFISIELSSQRIIRTINLILNSSELQTGLYRYKPIAINLNFLLTNIIKEHKTAAKIKNLNLSFNCRTSQTNIIADEYSVSQIFINLIDNAIKYTKNGGIDIELNSLQNGIIFATIVDTGIGMSNEFQARLFEPFTQEEHGYNRSYDGNGLGLSLVKNYCEMNNIKIEVESTKGFGTKFTLFFNH